MNEAVPRTLPASRRKWRFNWVWPVLAVLAVPVLVIVFFAAIPLLTIHKADSGFRKARATIKLEDLRAWALATTQGHPSTNGYAVEIPKAEIPDSIKELYSIPPENALAVPKTGENEGHVVIIWGGGFFHWAFDIGPTNFVSQYNPEYPKVFVLAPGIYYTREASWGLL